MRITTSLFVFAVSLATASAGTVDTPFSQILFGNNFANGGTSATLGGATNNGYTLTGTACFDGYCNQAAVEGFTTQTSGTPVNDPLTVRLTNLTLTCGGTCNGVAQVDTFFSFTEASQVGTVNVTIPLDGFGPAGTVMTVTGQANSCPMSLVGCNTATVPLNTTFIADSNGIFSGLINLGNITLLGISKINLGFSVMAPKNSATFTISLPSSLSLTYNAAVAAVPEPATLSVMALGLGALGMLIRKRRKS